MLFLNRHGNDDAFLLYFLLNVNMAKDVAVVVVLGRRISSSSYYY